MQQALPILDRLSSPDLQRQHGLSWLLMTTSASNGGWEEDVEILDLSQAGLPAPPSVVRSAKIATIDSQDAEYLGPVDHEVLNAVQRHLDATL